MKIEVELLKIDQDTDKARACAVALLSALPHDDAALAIAEWRAVQMVRAEDEAALREAYREAEAAVVVKTAVTPQDAGYSVAPQTPEQVRELTPEPEPLGRSRWWARTASSSRWTAPAPRS